MAKCCSRLLFFFSFFMLALSINTQTTFLYHTCPYNASNYTSNSAYQMNLNSIFSSFSSNTVIDYGFYNASTGQEPDKVNSIALCRGDVGLDKCRGCIRNATQKILQVCPNQKEALGWVDERMLRYSNKSMFGVLETGPTYCMWNPSNVSDDKSAFNQALQDSLRRLQSTAASGNSLLKFAAGETKASFQTIYALVQCTPDLSGQKLGQVRSGANG